jgi:hypothetical protein
VEINPPSINVTLEICCSLVGSTPSWADRTYGCPFNAVFYSQDNTTTFHHCASERGAGSICVVPSPPSDHHKVLVRWKEAMSFLLIGTLVVALSEFFSILMFMSCVPT